MNLYVHDTPAEFSEKDFLGICNLDADLPNEFVTIVLKLLETHRSIHISCDHFQESLPALRQYKWVRVTSLLRPFVAHLEDVVTHLAKFVTHLAKFVRVFNNS